MKRAIKIGVAVLAGVWGLGFLLDSFAFSRDAFWAAGTADGLLPHVAAVVAFGKAGICGGIAGALWSHRHAG